eukprot:1263946-Pyramimonas_sp.AAC.1
MEGGSLSKCSSRPSAAHILLERLQQLQGWRAAPFQNVALALAPRAFMFNACSRFKGSYAADGRNGLLARFRT